MKTENASRKGRNERKGKGVEDQQQIHALLFLSLRPLRYAFSAHP
jgi:hypothetical protein